MTRETVNRLCAAFPGARVSDPWGGGHDAWKVGGKMFACIGTISPGVSVKTPSIEDAEHLREAFGYGKAPYFHRSWVQVPFETDEAELSHRLKVSYETVRRGLPKKIRDCL